MKSYGTSGTTISNKYLTYSDYIKTVIKIFNIGTCDLHISALKHTTFFLILPRILKYILYNLYITIDG